MLHAGSMSTDGNEEAPRLFGETVDWYLRRVRVTDVTVTTARPALLRSRGELNRVDRPCDYAHFRAL